MTKTILTTGLTVLLGMLFCIVPTVLFAAPAQISHIQVIESGKSVRVILHVQHLQAYDSFTLDDPNRVVVDVHDGKLAMNLKQVALPAVIKKVRSGSPKPGVLRLVFDMRSAAEVESSHKQGANGDELYIEITPDSFPKSEAATTRPVHASSLEEKPEPEKIGAEKTAAKPEVEHKTKSGKHGGKTFQLTKPITMTQPGETGQKPATAPQSALVAVPQLTAAAKPVSQPTANTVVAAQSAVPVAKAAVTPAPATESTASTVKAAAMNLFSKLRLPSLAASDKPHQLVVVIDPGHGGKDSGTIGRHGTREKDIVLALAQELERLVNQDPSMHAVLTRTSDKFVTLEDRLTIARNQKADLFIAVHADSYFRNHSAGASVYALSQHGASSAAARWLADKENHSEVAGVDLNDKSLVLRSVLLDLAQTATISDSIKLGNDILTSLESITTLHNPSVEQAPFMVLKSPDIPSVLVETGFLSNQNEEQRLNESAYRGKLAFALLQGIRVYAANLPSVVTSKAKPGDALVWEAEHTSA